MMPPRCVQAVAAHPDDLEFSCAGALALWARQGTRVIYLICTSGEACFDRPDTVLCWDPIVRWINESMFNCPDHRAAAQAAVDAVFPFAGLVYLHEGFSREGPQPCKPDHLFVFRFEGGDTFFDIEQTFDSEFTSLKKHQSQIKDWDPGSCIGRVAERQGRAGGVRYAEAFKVIRFNRPPTCGR